MQGNFPKKAVHGGKILKLRQTFGTDFLDVSASMNPFVPDVSCDFSRVELGAYPDDTYTELKCAIGRVFSREPEEICVGNGSAELIRVYCSVVLEKGDAVRIDPPTFGEYRLSVELAGGEAVSFYSARPLKLRFICNPNNPTGELFSRKDMLEQLELCRKAGTQLFVDEAFMDLSESVESLSDVSDENLFVLRSLTKCFSVPGLRFGYGFGSAELVEKIETARTPWTVNAFAEKYAIAAFEQYDKLRDSAKKIAEEKSWYCSELDRLGVTYSDSSVNYLLINLRQSAAEFSEAMLARGVVVRDCTSFGLPESIRVSIERREVNKRVLEAIRECLL